MKLITKIHPKYFSYYLDKDTWGCVSLTRNLLSNANKIDEIFYALSEIKEIKEVYFENPHIQINGNYRDVVRDIVQVQRLQGVLEYKIWEYFSIFPGSLRQELPKPSKEEMIKMVDNLASIKLFLTPLEKLCIADCILLYNSLTIPKKVTAICQEVKT